LKSVIAEFEQGSKWDSRLLFFGVLFVICAFLSTYDTDIWQGSKHLLLPLSAVGVSLVIVDVILRIIRPKLKVTLLEIQGNQLKICPIRNLQFSGWLAGDPVTVSIDDIAGAKAYDFYNHGNKAGMYWVCLELKNQRVYEFNFDNSHLAREIIDFIRNTLPDVELKVDPKIRP
jgi:hypothetical protein